MNPKKPIESILGRSGEPAKCAVFPSGNVEFHVWKVKAKVGDKCQCGKTKLKQL